MVDLRGLKLASYLVDLKDIMLGKNLAVLMVEMLAELTGLKLVAKWVV